ncbi:MAG: hypothetical protein ACSHX8_00920 [Opitutaceae bacterium]
MPSTRLLASLAIGITIFAIGFLFAINSPKIYEATGIVQIYDGDGIEDPITIEQGLEVFNSLELANDVANRLVKDIEDGRLKTLLPEIHQAEKVKPSSEALVANSHFSQIRDSNAIRVSYESCDPEIAAYLCNAYMRSFINYWLKKDIDERMKKIEDQRIQADRAKERVEKAEMNLAKIIEARSKAEPDAIEALDQQYETLLEILKKEQEAFEKLVKEMTQEKAMVRLSYAKARIVEAAEVPETHIRPNLLLWSLYSAITGLFGALTCFKLMAKRK